jgi:hypothetical protein
MNAEEIRNAAKALLEQLETGEFEAPLKPFGDGPLEMELASRLGKSLPGRAGQAVIQKIISEAVGLNLPAVFDDSQQVQALARLASLAFIARYAEVSFSPTLLPFVIERLSTSTEVAEARMALADILRTISRTRTPVDSESVPIPLADDEDLRLAFAEFFAHSGDDRAIPYIASLPETAQADQLFWSLAQNSDFSKSIAQDLSPESGEVRSRIADSLQRIDDSGDAREHWLALLEELQQGGMRQFQQFDYRLERMAA